MTGGRVLLVWASVALADGPWVARARGETVPSPAVKPRIVASRTASAPAIDGRLDDGVWAVAQPVSGFVQVDPVSGAAATQDTEVRVLYDDRAIYLGVRCADSAGAVGVRVPNLRRDFDDTQHDLFGVSFDPFGDGRTAQAFQINPWGALRDLKVSDDSEQDRDWDAVWTARTAIAADGWTAEIEIPWSTLRYPVGARDWGAQFVRRVRRLEETSGWAPWPRGMSPYRMTYAGAMGGLEPPPPRRQLRLQPYLLGSAERAGEPGQGSEDSAEVGADLKWLPDSATAVDLTVNTDFAQADADRQVVNLSRFSVFFPERRQFFLESASLFDSSFDNLKPFFSRRVGLDDTGRPVPVLGGARVVHQDGERQWGGLLVQTEAARDQPAALFAVARFSENLGERNRFGGSVVARRDAARNEQPGRQNVVGSLDGLWRPHELFTFQGFVSASATDGAGGDGLAGAFWAYSRGPRGYFGWLQEFVSADFEASAGFVSRSDLITTSPAVTFDWRPRWLPKNVRSLKPNTVGYLYHSYETREFQEGWWRFEPLWVVLQDGSEVWAWWQPNWQRLDEPFEPLPGLVVPPGDYDYDNWGLAAASDRSRPYGVEIKHRFGGFFDGTLDSTEATLRASPSPRVALLLEARHDVISSLGPERRHRTSDLWGPELRLAWNPRLQLTAFYQRNEASELASWYARISWEVRPLSFFYLVYSDRLPTDPLAGVLQRPDRRERQLIVKLAWSFER